MLIRGLVALLAVLATQDPPRTPVPSEADQAQAHKLIRDVFKSELSRTDPLARRALARKMIEQSRDPRGDAAASFVLLREAREIGNQVGDLSLATDAIDEVSRRFDVDASALRLAAITSAAKFARTPEELQAVARGALKAVEVCLRRDEVDVADKLLAAAAQSARKSQDAALVGRVAARTKEVGDLKARFGALKKARETLASNPDDGAANVLVGKHLCLVKGNWAEGLPLLAKGSDVAFRDRALSDLKDPAQAADQAAVGDGWWELGEKDAAKEALRDRAALWYGRALPKLAGLSRTKTEKRLAEHHAARLARGTWLDITDPKLFSRPGKAGESVEVKGQLGFQTHTICRGFPLGDFDAVSVQLTLDPAAKTRAYVMVEPDKAAAFADCGTGTVGFARRPDQTLPWKPEFEVKSDKPDAVTIAVELAGGEYVLYVDHLEKGRSKTAETALKSIGFNTYFGDVRIEKLRLRRAE
jgi:hypothetical protein